MKQRHVFEPHGGSYNLRTGTPKAPSPWFFLLKLWGAISTIRPQIMRPVLENTLSQEKLPLKSLSPSPVCDLSSGADPYSLGLVAADAIDISCEISWMQMSGATLSSREGGEGEREVGGSYAETGFLRA